MAELSLAWVGFGHSALPLAALPHHILEVRRTGELIDDFTAKSWTTVLAMTLTLRQKLAKVLLKCSLRCPLRYLLS